MDAQLAPKFQNHIVQSARAKTCRGRQVRIVLPTGEEFIPHPQEHEEDHHQNGSWKDIRGNLGINTWRN